MKIITYNVNGLRAAVSKGLPEWLVQENPDILCLQETKLQPDQYPAEVFEALGYRAYHQYFRDNCELHEDLYIHLLHRSSVAS